MGKLVELPFQSYHRLREWRDSQKAEEPFGKNLKSVWYNVMDKHFQAGPDQIRVYAYEEEVGTRCVDVQFEGEIEGDPFQLYLMTLVTVEFSEEQRAFFPESDTLLDYGVTIEELSCPFEAPTILWDSREIGPPEIVAAVTAWSQKFWPDFACEYVYGKLPESPWEEPLAPPADTKPLSPTLCRVLVDAGPERRQQVWSWLLAHGCDEVYVSPNSMMLLLDFPVKFLSKLRDDFKDLPFVTSAT